MRQSLTSFGKTVRAKEKGQFTINLAIEKAEASWERHQSQIDDAEQIIAEMYSEGDENTETETHINDEGDSSTGDYACG
jgi:hypothetical protein